MIHPIKANENKKYIEESMFHELVHASLDWQWGKKSVEEDKWLNAISTDKYYVSNYAWENPKQEDLAETVVQELEKESFVILPHPIVLEYMRNKTNNYDRWIGGMNKLMRKITGVI